MVQVKYLHAGTSVLFLIPPHVPSHLEEKKNGVLIITSLHDSNDLPEILYAYFFYRCLLV